MKTQKAPLTGGVDLVLDYRTMLKGLDWETKMQIIMHNLALAHQPLQQPKNSGLNDLCQRIGEAVVAVKTALAQKEETQKKANIILRELGEAGILAMIQEKRYGKR